MCIYISLPGYNCPHTATKVKVRMVGGALDVSEFREKAFVRLLTHHRVAKCISFALDDFRSRFIAPATNPSSAPFLLLRMRSWYAEQSHVMRGGITLLSVVGKVFCKTLNNTLVEHLDKEKVLHKGQVGFRTNRSCVDNYLHFKRNCTR